MLQGLGRYLRCCGVDVTMLANEDDHDKAAQVSNMVREFQAVARASNYRKLQHDNGSKNVKHFSKFFSSITSTCS